VQGMKIHLPFGLRPLLRLRPDRLDRPLRRGTPKAPRAPRGAAHGRRRTHRLALARRDRLAELAFDDPFAAPGLGEALGTLPRTPRRRLHLGRLWAHRIATGRAPGLRPRGPGL
jgi:hypothetical protein